MVVGPQGVPDLGETDARTDDNEKIRGSVLCNLKLNGYPYRIFVVGTFAFTPTTCSAVFDEIPDAEQELSPAPRVCRLG